MLTYEQVMESLCRSDVIVNIGQIDAATQRKLEKMVRAGTVKKWRGHWFPIAGAPCGIGPLKTCYGIEPAHDWAVASGPKAIEVWNRMAAEDKAARQARAEGRP